MTNSVNDTLARWNLSCDEKALAALTRYEEILLEWNEKFNLTAVTDTASIWEKHFLDSLSPLILEELASVKTALDVGTGAGFPGAVLKLFRPAWHVVLMDSLNKRVGFLNALIAELGLTGIEAVHGRAEEMARIAPWRDGFDVVFSRAVAPMPTLLEYCLPFTAAQGYFVAMKGPKGAEEAAEAKRAASILKAELVKIAQVPWPDRERNTTLVLYRKLAPTPKGYPRSGGKPRSKPL